MQGAHKGFGFAACRAVADGNGLYLMFFTQHHHRLARFPALLLGKGRKNRGKMKQPALPVQAHQFSSCAKSRVQGHDPFLAHGRCQQEFTQITGKDPDRFLIGLVFQVISQFIFKGRAKKSFVRVFHRQRDLPARFIFFLYMETLQ